MDSFLKNIKIKFDPDEASYKKIEKDIEKLGKFDLFDDKSAKILKEQLGKFTSLKNQIREIEDAIESISEINSDVANNARKQLEDQKKVLEKQLNSVSTERKEKRKQLTSDIISAVGDGFTSFGSALQESDSKLAKTFGSFTNGLGDVFESGSKLLSGDFDSLNDIVNSALKSLGKLLANGLDELDNMLNFSKMSNQKTRDLMFQYGFSGSQAYGFDKAMSVLGFGSEEDLFYANTQEIEQFRNAFQKYSEKYNELYDKGMFEKMQEFNVEMEAFQEDIKLEVVDFFMNNKDTIKAAMEGMIDLAEVGVVALEKIIKWLNPNARTSDYKRAANAASIIGNYSNVTSKTNVSIDNTFNNVSKSDQTWLANAGQMTYEQIVKALS